MSPLSTSDVVRTSLLRLESLAGEASLTADQVREAIGEIYLILVNMAGNTFPGLGGALGGFRSGPPPGTRTDQAVGHFPDEASIMIQREIPGAQVVKVTLLGNYHDPAVWAKLGVAYAPNPFFPDPTLLWYNVTYYPPQ